MDMFYMQTNVNIILIACGIMILQICDTLQTQMSQEFCYCSFLILILQTRLVNLLYNRIKKTNIVNMFMFNFAVTDNRVIVLIQCDGL